MNEVIMDDLRPVRGAIHIHTDYHDGDAPMAEIAGVAEAARLDYLIVTDHHQAYAFSDGWSGRKKTAGMLIVVGTEHRTREHHDILGLGLVTTVATRNLASKEALGLLSRLGATTFIAHPQGNKTFPLRRLHPWVHWENKHFDGVEVWCYMHDWIRSFSLRNLAQMCRQPTTYIQGPEGDILVAWDDLARKRRVAGLGALDVHGRKLPLGLSRLIPWAKEGILPYASCFRAFVHYALVPAEWGAHDAQDQAALLRSLKCGFGWICHEALEPGGEFLFMLEESGVFYPMGTERFFCSGQQLHVSSPVKARIRLWSRGTIVQDTTGHALEYEPESAGEYRVEVLLKDRPWIYSNHIYLREPGRFDL